MSFEWIPDEVDAWRVPLDVGPAIVPQPAIAFSDVMAQLLARLAKAQEDTAILNYLEAMGIATRVEYDTPEHRGISCFRYEGRWQWVAHHIAEFPDLRSAALAVMERAAQTSGLQINGQKAEGTTGAKG